MQSMAPADELAMVRTQIAHLKTRERALRDALICASAAARIGRWSIAEVVERQIRLFDHRLLPQPLRDDPAYWTTRAHTEVNCRPLGIRPPPGHPLGSGHGRVGLTMQ